MMASARRRCACPLLLAGGGLRPASPPTPLGVPSLTPFPGVHRAYSHPILRPGL